MTLDLISFIIGAGSIYFMFFIQDHIIEPLYARSKFDNPYLNYFMLGRKIKQK